MELADRLTVYYDEVTIISTLCGMFNGIPGGVLGRNICSRIFSLQVAIHRIQILPTPPHYVRVSRRNLLYDECSVTNRDSSRLLARTVEIVTCDF